MPRLIRTWVPLALVVIGLVAVVAGGLTTASMAVGIPILSIGLCMLTVSLVYRAGVIGDRERDVEERARAYFREHGHWPDEAPGAGREGRDR